MNKIYMVLNNLMRNLEMPSSHRPEPEIKKKRKYLPEQCMTEVIQLTAEPRTPGFEGCRLFMMFEGQRFIFQTVFLLLEEVSHSDLGGNKVKPVTKSKWA